jgi:hypothetical protein
MKTTLHFCYMCDSEFAIDEKTGKHHLDNNKKNYMNDRGESNIHMHETSAKAFQKRNSHEYSMDLYMCTQIGNFFHELLWSP